MQALKDLINHLFSAQLFVTLSIILFFIAFSPFMFFGALQKLGIALCKKAGWDEGATRLFPDSVWKAKPEAVYNWIWSPRGGITILAVVLGLFLLALTDYNFRLIITAPDNVPIVGMLGLVGFCLWLSLSQARVNDARIAAGGVPLEKESSSKRVFSWPDQVYSELIAMVLATVVLIVWSVFLKAPLEDPANPTSSPNPAKAPWYFLGLQELLVYFDPWIAGVLLPGLVVVGLMAIPYIDVNKKGNGYFTFKERQTEISFFLFGFIVLWVLLIIMGTFLRGPNWNFFGPFETWDVHKLVPLNNVNLSEFFWVRMLGSGHFGMKPLLSSASLSKIMSGGWMDLVKEAPGFVALIGYVVLWWKLAKSKLLEKYRSQMSPLQFSVLVVLMAIMIAVPIKMYLRWIFNLKYILTFPKIAFNI
jgi:hypothetical protein